MNESIRPGLVDASKGDGLYVNQMVSGQTPEGIPYLRLARSAVAAPFTQTDGSTTSVNVTLADAPPAQPLTIDFRKSAFDAAVGFDGTHALALNPSSSVIPPGGYEPSWTADVIGHVGPPDFGRYANSADYLALYPPAASADIVARDVNYSTLGSGWSTAVLGGAKFRVGYASPGTSNFALVELGAVSVDKLGTASTVTLQPTVGPVRSPTIDGRDLFSFQVGISPTPKLAWLAPALGTPTLYDVQIARLTAFGGVNRLALVAVLFTDKTSITIPPGILEVDGAYVILIEAGRGPTITAPLRARFPTSAAMVASNILYVAAPPSPCPSMGSYQMLQDASGASRFVFQRTDGAILLAHYGAGARQTAYDPNLPQIVDVNGGSSAPDSFVPDPCNASGHLAFSSFNPAGREVIFECGAAYDGSQFSVSSSSLFTSFGDGTYGTYGATGSPGWGMLAALGSGEGRSSHASCGSTQDATTGGLAMCSGTGSLFSNHLVSYYTTTAMDSPYVGCNGNGCNGSTCNLQVWVWLK
jgi:hypothetical protein